ncbi:MAG: hypothetical protein F4234_04205 [Gammaproteobacteria bacterium]|nr:hypothetical protein [Gammaproteobacteria bacterium]
MKLILSRKGFDSSSGGCPSPVFPDGAMLSLPIPDKNSDIRYSSIKFQGTNLGQLLVDLTGQEKRRNNFAHLDPDLNSGALAREPGWRPLLGQASAAQGHLDNQKVGIGDLFLFFGLYQRVKKTDGKWRFDKLSRREHVLWGWLQIGAEYKVRRLREGELDWAEYHPHLQSKHRRNNTLYAAADNLRIKGKQFDFPAAGIFSNYDERLVLTAPKPNRKCTQWRLPPSFFPSPGKPPLSYHCNLERWQRSESGGYCLLSSVSRGQEFVLDLEHYPDVTDWLESLLPLATSP